MRSTALSNGSSVFDMICRVLPSICTDWTPVSCAEARRKRHLGPWLDAAASYRVPGVAGAGTTEWYVARG